MQFTSTYAREYIGIVTPLGLNCRLITIFTLGRDDAKVCEKYWSELFDIPLENYVENASSLRDETRVTSRDDSRRSQSVTGITT